MENVPSVLGVLRLCGPQHHPEHQATYYSIQKQQTVIEMGSVNDRIIAFYRNDRIPTSLTHRHACMHTKEQKHTHKNSEYFGCVVTGPLPPVTQQLTAPRQPQ